MDKVMAAVQAIKEADAAVRAVVRPLRIDIGQVIDYMTVHVRGIQDLECLPGEMASQEISCPAGNITEYYKVVEGVRFFCLVNSPDEMAWVV